MDRGCCEKGEPRPVGAPRYLHEFTLIVDFSNHRTCSVIQNHDLLRHIGIIYCGGMGYGESDLTPIRTPLCQIDRARNLYRVRRMIFSRYIGDVAAALGLIFYKNLRGVWEG